ncbi:hypothetical protein Y032_0012g1737 [Ancylostoma ceylanicum]|uniref:UDENN FLCN/SMCR8-type domain-containing protein n=1 Tax=Ancylostoma ceylanicum TaxID=53326 RepID=A0A016VBY3_9BILA|nr:hypothetical protein Y032_0012g1737 [Ancylostoma ceylanicum]
MIVLVWSLVSSVVEAARRRKLAAFLANFLSRADADGMMLVCRHIAAARSITSSTSSSRLSRYSSDPQLNAGHSRSVLYRNERAEVTTENSEPLRISQWRFVRGSIEPPTAAESRVFFVAQRSALMDVVGIGDADGSSVPYCSVFLDSSCERVGFHRYAAASLYSCSLDRFVDVVYAFSEGALFDNIVDARLIDHLHTVSLPYNQLSGDLLRTASPLAQSLTHLNQRPLSLLEQLYLGDARPWNEVRERFASEGALHVVCQHGFDSVPRASQ